MGSGSRRVFVAVAVLLAGSAVLAGSAAGAHHPSWPRGEPSLSPDGRTVVFTETNPTGLNASDVYRMNIDGSGLRRLTSSPAHDLHPSWSADGRKIVFASNRDQRNYDLEIYVMNADGSRQTRVTRSSPTTSAYNTYPSFSPDGRSIVFTSLRDGNHEVYVMNASGSGQTRLTRNDAYDLFPKWSPDGKSIAFASNRDGNLEIYSMRADGTGQARLTDSPGSDAYPAWSPDSRKLTFAGDRNGDYEIFSINADGSSLLRLTRTPRDDVSPSFAPGGGRIGFASNRAGTFGIYVMNADGTGQLRLEPSHAASAATMAIGLQAAGATAVAQGMPFRFRAGVRNRSKSPIKVDVSFSLLGAGRQVPFLGTPVSIPAGTSVTLRGSVIPAQWFRQSGRFRVVAKVDGRTLGKPVAFRVTQPTAPVPQFADMTARAGLTTTLPNFDCGRLSAGAAWGDVDGDRDLDIYLPRRLGPSVLGINDGSGRFSEQGAPRGADNALAPGLGAVFADYDNDGDQDLYVLNDGPNRLYRNDGKGVFTDVAVLAGVAGDATSVSASWGDYDNDGLLDLYVTNYLRCLLGSSFGGTTQLDKLYHNEGDGTFSDQTPLLENDPARRDDGSTIGAGFQAAWFDFDGDRDLDLYLANDFIGPNPDRNHLWRNDGRSPQGRWRFTDISVASGTSYSMNSMGLAVGDYDRDLDLDLAISNIESNRLLRNNRNGTFTDVAAWARVARPKQRVAQKSITWGTGFYDFNLDGWEDLYFAAGYLGEPEAQRNELFVNGRNGRFLDLSSPSRADDAGNSKGVAFADYDRDGRVDLFVVNQAGTPRLLRNVTPSRGRHWLEVHLAGSRSNRDGCGARVTATVRGRAMLRQVFCGSISLGSGSDPTLHFGLGEASSASRVVVQWPSGIRQVRQNVRGDRMITVAEPRVPFR